MTLSERAEALYLADVKAAGAAKGPVMYLPFSALTPDRQEEYRKKARQETANAPAD